MRFSFAVSLALHCLVALVVYFGMPSLFEPRGDIPQAIPVAIYTVAEETNLPTAAPEPKPEPEPEPEPEEEPEAEPEPEAAPPPEPPKPTEAAAPPEEKPAKPAEIAPPPPPKPADLAKPKPEPEPPKPEPPKPEPEPEPQRTLDSLLADITDKPQEPPTPEPEEAAQQQPALVVAQTATSGVASEPLSLSVIDAIRRQVEEQWSVPAGAKDAGDLVVEIRIQLRTDGSVIRADIIEQGRLDDQYFRAMAESARRAVLKASPLQDLPPEKYEQWRDITFTFRPPVS